MTTLLRDNLAPLDPCDEALRWLGRRRSASKAWADCARGDWMLWLLARVGADRRTLVLTTCDCARLALVHVPAGEDRPRLAIETAEAWARGEATEAEVRRAAHDADLAAAYAAARAAAAAYAAASAADAAYAAAHAAAAHAAYAAAYAADAADADDAAAVADAAARAAAARAAAAAARDATLTRCADLVRARFPHPPEVTR